MYMVAAVVLVVAGVMPFTTTRIAIMVVGSVCAAVMASLQLMGLHRLASLHCVAPTRPPLRHLLRWASNLFGTASYIAIQPSLGCQNCWRFAA